MCTKHNFNPIICRTTLIASVGTIEGMTTQQDTGCFNCGADVDHFTICHGTDIYTCETLQEIDSEEHAVIMGWLQ